MIRWVIEHTEITMNISRCRTSRICFVLSCEDEFCMLTNVAIAYSRQIGKSVHLPASQENEDRWQNDENEVDHGRFRFFELENAISKRDMPIHYLPLCNYPQNSSHSSLHSSLGTCNSSRRIDRTELRTEIAAQLRVLKRNGVSTPANWANSPELTIRIALWEVLLPTFYKIVEQIITCSCRLMLLITANRCSGM